MSRRPRSALVLCLAALLALPACGSSGAAGSPSMSAAAPHRDPRRILQEEVEEAMGQNIQSMYDLVMLRHSDWVRPTTTISGAHQVVVYLDRARLGGAEQLRTVALRTVDFARYLTPSEAQGEFGLDNLGGAIAITTKRQ